MLDFPKRLFLEITTECNLRCKLCNFWQNKDPSNKITLTTKLNFLKKFVNWLELNADESQNSFSLILTGGEPFLYPDHVFELAKLCRTYDLDCNVNTNGFLIDIYPKKVLNSGLTALTISIDSHNAQIHDSLRGSVGLFNHLIKIITELKKKKEENKYPLKLCVQSILGSWNINSLSAHIDFFRNLGIDGIMFQPIQYPFGLLIPRNWHEGFKRFPHSEKDIQNGIDYLLSLKKSNGFLMNSVDEIKLWAEYFKNPEYIQNHVNPCRAYDQNLIIDVCGNVKFCFNKELKPKNKIGNIKNVSLDEIWMGETARQEKEEMKYCNRSCGIMACHIDTNLREK